MKISSSILLIGLCFVTGVGASLGLRVKKQEAKLITASPEGWGEPIVPDDSKTAGLTSKPADEREVFGRIESIDGLAKAIAVSDPKGIGQWSRRLGKTDVFLACDMLAGAAKSQARDLALRQLIESAATVDAFRAFAFFGMLGGGGAQDDTRGYLIGKMAEKDAKLAWDTLSKSKSLTNADVEKIAGVWGKSQGYAASTFGLSLQDPMRRSLFLRKTIAAWMAEDMVSFARWFAQQPAGADLERFVEFGGFSDYHASKPPSFATLDAAVALNVGVNSSSMYQMFEHAWKNATMREKAAEWIAAQKDAEVRDVAWKHLALQFAESDPARAREILPLIGDPGMRQHATSTLAAEMAKSTPLEAMQFAAAVEEQGAREKSLASAMVTWAKTQPGESLAYLREHPEQLQPEYLSHAAREWVKVDPVGAMEVVDSLAEQSARQGELERLARDWYQRRPDQADAWLASASSGRLKEAVQKAKAEPAKENRLRGVSWSGPTANIETHHGNPGESSTTATIGGRTMRYFY